MKAGRDKAVFWICDSLHKLFGKEWLNEKQERSFKRFILQKEIPQCLFFFTFYAFHKLVSNFKCKRYSSDPLFDRLHRSVHSIFWMNEEKNKKMKMKMKMVVVRESVILKPLGQKMETQSLFNCSVLGQWLAKTFWKWHVLGSNPSLGTCSHLRSKFRWWTSYFLKAEDNIL